MLTDVSTAVVNEKEVVIEEVQEDDNEKSDEEQGRTLKRRGREAR